MGNSSPRALRWAPLAGAWHGTSSTLPCAAPASPAGCRLDFDSFCKALSLVALARGCSLPEVAARVAACEPRQPARAAHQCCQPTGAAPWRPNKEATATAAAAAAAKASQVPETTSHDVGVACAAGSTDIASCKAGSGGALSSSQSASGGIAEPGQQQEPQHVLGPGQAEPCLGGGASPAGLQRRCHNAPQAATQRFGRGVTREDLRRAFHMFTGGEDAASVCCFMPARMEWTTCKELRERPLERCVWTASLPSRCFGRPPLQARLP